MYSFRVLMAMLAARRSAVALARSRRRRAPRQPRYALPPGQRRPAAGHRLRPGQSHEFVFGRRRRRISMPLIGRVQAQGLTTAALERPIEARLRQGFLREPSVSVEVEAYPAILRARRSQHRRAIPVHQRHDRTKGGRRRRRLHPARGPEQVDDHPHRSAAGDVLGAVSFPIRPGDAVTVEERFF